MKENIITILSALMVVGIISAIVLTGKTKEVDGYGISSIQNSSTQNDTELYNQCVMTAVQSGTSAKECMLLK